MLMGDIINTGEDIERHVVEAETGPAGMMWMQLSAFGDDALNALLTASALSVYFEAKRVETEALGV